MPSNDPDIYDDDVQEGMILEMVAAQVAGGYFDGEDEDDE